MLYESVGNLYVHSRRLEDDEARAVGRIRWKGASGGDFGCFAGEFRISEIGYPKSEVGFHDSEVGFHVSGVGFGKSGVGIGNSGGGEWAHLAR